MRFKRYGRYPFNDTPRKRAAVLRKQRNEREALPLFADQIAGEQPSVDAEVAPGAYFVLPRGRLVPTSPAAP